MGEARQATFRDDYERPWTYLQGAIRTAMERGELRDGDAALMSQICFSAFVGQLQIARFGSDIPYPPLSRVGEIADLLLAGLEPR